MIQFGRDKETGYWLRAEMLVEQPLETVFEFFADARQLERITPPILNFKILTPMPVEIKAGLLRFDNVSIFCTGLRVVSATNPDAVGRNLGLAVATPKSR